MTAARLRPAAIVLAAAVLLALLPLARPAHAVENDSSPIFINELHYDNAGTDAGEFVEVVATDGTDASGYSIVLYNGSGGATYDSDALGPLAATASGVNYYTVEYPTNGIQNGAPDGIALSDTSGALVQFLSYEGSLTASDGPANGQASTDIGVEEGSSTPAGQSLQLGGSGTTYGDFAWAAPADDTPGAANNSQTFGTGGGGGEPEPEPVRIREIQGDGHISPLLGEQVADVPGIVTARKRNGFYLQDVREIETTRASDGLFVFTGSAPSAADAAVGNEVTVSGTVGEFRPGGDGNLSVTQIGSPTIAVTAMDQPLPAPVVLGTGGRVPPGVVIDDDNDGESSGEEFEPDTNGIDFYETVEGMRIQITDAVAADDVDTRFSEFAIISAGTTSVRSVEGGVVLREVDTAPSGVDFNPERILVDDEISRADDGGFGNGIPQDVEVGDTFTTPVTGIGDYGFGNYRIQVTQPLTRVERADSDERTATPAADELAIATFNVLNLDPGDDQSKFDGLAAEIVENLRAPDVIGLQEIQDNTGPTDDDGVVAADQTYQGLIDAISDAGGPAYSFTEVTPENNDSGGQPGANIRVGYLFREDRGLEFVSKPGGTATNGAEVQTDERGATLSVSPGIIDPTNPILDDERKPTAAEFEFNGERVIAIVNHFNSKRGDGALFGSEQPPDFPSEEQRANIAGLVNGFVDDILAADPDANVVVLGDLNDFQFSDALDVLEGGETPVLDNLVDTLETEDQFSFVFQGNSQILDHILVGGGLRERVRGFDVLHLNSGEPFPTQFSDHDPMVARLGLAGPPPPEDTPAALDVVARYTGTAAEINAYDPTTEQFYVTNPEIPGLDVLELNPSTFELEKTDERVLADEDADAGVTSVAVRPADGLVAVAAADDPETEPGQITFFAADGTQLGVVDVPALPDGITFTPDGTRLVVANEGEPDDGVDPAGAITLIDVPAATAAPFTPTSTELRFDGFDPAAFDDSGVFQPDDVTFPDFAQPEFPTVAPDGATAYVSVQESNALAVVDLATETITDVVGLGAKDHSVPGQGLDPDPAEADGIDIDTFANVTSVHAPDALAAFDVGDETYVVTANEGDSRDEDVERVGDLDLDPTAFPDGTEDLGERLEVLAPLGDDDGDGDYDRLFPIGARSFSIHTADGTRVFDSGDQLEQLTAAAVPEIFNSSESDPDEFDQRSDDSGPEPEGLATGVVDGTPLAFLALERVGGIVVIDLSEPTDPAIIDYVNTSVPDEQDIAPEGVTFVPADGSPTDGPLLAVSFEGTGDTTLYAVEAEGRLSEKPTFDPLDDIDDENETAFPVSGSAAPGAAVEITLTDELDNQVVETVTASAGDGRFSADIDTTELADGEVTVTAVATEPERDASVPSTTSVAKATSYTLTLLHNNDGESNLLPDGKRGGVARFTTLVEELRDEGLTDTDGALTISSGDNFLAGPRFAASLENGVPFFDSIALDEIGYDALAIGNHEFDFGPDVLADFIESFDLSGDERGMTAEQFVSANLDVSAEPRLQTLADSGVIVASTSIQEGGREIGVVGATTPLLPSISSPRDVEVDPEVAEAVQAEVDRLTAESVTVVVLTSHLQSVDEDLDLLTELRDVDVAIAGGGDELLANDDDELLEGDEAERPYPLLASDADSVDVPVVTTAGGYGYVGRLTASFDGAGDLVEVLEPSGPVANPDEGTDSEATVREQDPTVLEDVEEPVAAFVADLAATNVAETEVDLSGVRSEVRTRETNLGNLLADALRDAGGDDPNDTGAPDPVIGLQNGGGIRNDSVLPAGEPITALDTFDVAPFSNFVGVVTDITPEQLKEILENAVGRVEFTDGRFAQISGLSFVYDPEAQSGVDSSDAGNPQFVSGRGERVITVTLDDGAPIVVDGEVVEGAPDVSIATNDFTARGGDQFPFPPLTEENFFNTGVSYQQALRSFLEDADDLDGLVTCTEYPPGGEGRILQVGQSAPTDPCDDPADTTAPDAPTITAEDIDEDNEDAYPVRGDAEEGSTVEVTATDEDGDGVTGTDVANSPYEVVLDVSGLDDGEITLTATATDAAGNTSDPGVTTVTKDTGAQPGPGPSVPPADEPTDDPTTAPAPLELERISGEGRTQTALEISRRTFGDDEAGGVVLSRPDIFPDALAGTPLAVQEDAPLLLTSSDGLEPEVATEIQRVLPENATVYLLGGTAALTQQVADDVEALGLTVVRYGGANRFDTARILATDGIDGPSTVILADGSNFPDAVSAGAAAGVAGGAVILTGADTVPAETAAYLAANPSATLFAAGGPAARAVPTATALVGATRIETAVTVARQFFDAPTAVGLATTGDFPDALAGGAAVARAGGPLLLTFTDTVPTELSDYLNEISGSVEQAFIFGGTNAVDATVESRLTTLLGGS